MSYYTFLFQWDYTFLFLSFSYFFSIPPSLWGSFPCIVPPLASQPSICTIFRKTFGCLFHQDPSGGGRRGCELWKHCSYVMSSWMRPIQLVQCIKCGGTFPNISSFLLSVAYTTLLSSLRLCFMVQLIT